MNRHKAVWRGQWHTITKLSSECERFGVHTKDGDRQVANTLGSSEWQTRKDGEEREQTTLLLWQERENCAVLLSDVKTPLIDSWKIGKWTIQIKKKVKAAMSGANEYKTEDWCELWQTNEALLQGVEDTRTWPLDTKSDMTGARYQHPQMRHAINKSKSRCHS